MTLYELAKKNLRHNFKQYILYLYPMVSSIAIYFTFVSLQYNKQVNDSAVTVEKIGPAFSAASILLFIFASLFIWYSNAFFIKKRKKEIGLYSLFGMRKKQIAKLLFNEILILGILALAVGIGIGFIFTKLFSMILIKLMGANQIAAFTISTKALFQTCAAFSITILFAALYNYQMIYKYTLLQLFQAERKGEGLPKAALIPAALSIIFISGGYAILLQPSTSDLWKNHGFLFILLSLLALLVGTYLLLRSLSIWALNWLSKLRKIAWKGVHLIGISSLLYRIKGSVLILSVIALLTTLTLFSMGTAFSLYHNMNSLMKITSPHSFMYTVPAGENAKRIEKQINENGESNLVYLITLPYIEVKGDLSEFSKLSNEYPLLLFSESDYHRLAEKMGVKNSFTLNDQQAISFYDGGLDQKGDPYIGKRARFGDRKEVTIISYERFSLVNQWIFAFPIVISDQLFQQMKSEAEVSNMQFVKIKNEKAAKKLADNIQNLLDKEENLLEDPFELPISYFMSYYHEYQKMNETYGLLVFISSFIGLVFLLATGSMLYYKQLTEAFSERTRYKMLKKIGMNKKQIRQSIRNQIRLVFVLPLIIAIAHSTVIITALSNFLQINMMYPFLVAIGLYILIYYMYYLFTVSKYYRIVEE